MSGGVSLGRVQAGHGVDHWPQYRVVGGWMVSKWVGPVGVMPV